RSAPKIASGDCRGDCCIAKRSSSDIRYRAYPNLSRGRRMAYFVILVKRRPITSASVERRRSPLRCAKHSKGESIAAVLAVEKAAPNIPCGTFGDRRKRQYSHSAVAHTAGTAKTTRTFASRSLA